MVNKRIFDHYEVFEEFREDGLWRGYTVRCLDSTGKQGKLYLKSDGRHYYKSKSDTEDLEL